MDSKHLGNDQGQGKKEQTTRRLDNIIQHASTEAPTGKQDESQKRRSL